MQKMSFIFLSKRSCRKLFSARRLYTAAGNAYLHWLSAHRPQHGFPGNYSEALKLFGSLFTGINARPFAVTNPDLITIKQQMSINTQSS